MAKCPRCGTSRVEYAAYCHACGNPLNRDGDETQNPRYAYKVAVPTYGERTQNNAGRPDNHLYSPTPPSSDGTKIAIVIITVFIALVIIFSVSMLYEPDYSTDQDGYDDSGDYDAPPDTYVPPETYEPDSTVSSAYVVIGSDTSWMGVYGNENGDTTVEGTGDTRYSVSGDIISAVFQKDTSYGTLTLSIVVDGVTEQTQTTTAEYGVVSVCWSIWDDEY